MRLNVAIAVAFSTLLLAVPLAAIYGLGVLA